MSKIFTPIEMDVLANNKIGFVSIPTADYKRVSKFLKHLAVIEEEAVESKIKEKQSVFNFLNAVIDGTMEGNLDLSDVSGTCPANTITNGDFAGGATSWGVKEFDPSKHKKIGVWVIEKNNDIPKVGPNLFDGCEKFEPGASRIVFHHTGNKRHVKVKNPRGPKLKFQTFGDYVKEHFVPSDKLLIDKFRRVLYTFINKELMPPYEVEYTPLHCLDGSAWVIKAGETRHCFTSWFDSEGVHFISTKNHSKEIAKCVENAINTPFVDDPYYDYDAREAEDDIKTFLKARGVKW